MPTVESFTRNGKTTTKTYYKAKAGRNRIIKSVVLSIDYDVVDPATGAIHSCRALGKVRLIKPENYRVSQNVLDQGKKQCCIAQANKMAFWVHHLDEKGRIRKDIGAKPTSSFECGPIVMAEAELLEAVNVDGVPEMDAETTASIPDPEDTSADEDADIPS